MSETKRPEDPATPSIKERAKTLAQQLLEAMGKPDDPTLVEQEAQAEEAKARELAEFHVRIQPPPNTDEKE